MTGLDFSAHERNGGPATLKQPAIAITLICWVFLANNKIHATCSNLIWEKPLQFVLWSMRRKGTCTSWGQDID